jgi:hypothetical protein
MATMAIHGAQQQDMTWLHEDPDFLRSRPRPSLYVEYTLRREVGQHPEVWETRGGADGGDLGGYTLLWIPEESVYWAFNCGLEPAWYYSPLSLGALLKQFVGVFTSDWRDWCTELKYYRAVSQACAHCGGRLDADDWTTALAIADGEPSDPLCETCREAEYETYCREQGDEPL